MTENLHPNMSFLDENQSPYNQWSAERFRLLDLQAQHEQELTRPELGGGMSLAEKAALLGAQEVADELDAMPEEEKQQLIAQHGPSELEYLPYMGDPNDQLERAYIKQTLEPDGNGNEVPVPTIHLSRKVYLSEDDIARGRNPAINFNGLAQDVRMAQVLSDGTLMPRGEFTQEDLEVGQRMLAELRQAREDNILPNLRATSLDWIPHPSMATAVDVRNLSDPGPES